MSKGIMISCKETSELVIQRNQIKLSFGDWMKLQMHLLMCKFCRRFAIQNKFIDQAMHHLNDHQNNHIPDDFKERVLHQLEK